MAMKTKPASRPNVPVKTTTKSKAAAAKKPVEQKSGQYDDTNRGVLFQNEKDGNESRPDFTGKINVDGVEKRLAAWTKESDKVNGGTFLSILVSDLKQD